MLHFHVKGFAHLRLELELQALLFEDAGESFRYLVIHRRTNSVQVLNYGDL